jgi:ParB/RepB/Spo0J family partition protein
MERLAHYDTFAIPIASIFYDSDFNCRGEFTLESVQALAGSITRKGGYPRGLDIPIIVQPFDESEFQYRLLAGHRRYTACKSFLKWQFIPAQIRANLTEEEARILNFTENLERKDLNILEEARALTNTFNKGQSLREIAKAVKRETRWVQVRQRLIAMPEEVQKQAAAGLLNAEMINRVWLQPTPELQIKAADAIARIRARGRKRSIADLEYQPRVLPRRTKAQMQEMVEVMLNFGVEGLGPRALVWAAGGITEDELREDIADQIRVQRRLASVTRVCTKKSPNRRSSKRPRK